MAAVVWLRPGLLMGCGGGEVTGRGCTPARWVRATPVAGCELCTGYVAGTAGWLPLEGGKIFLLDIPTTCRSCA